MRFLKNIRAEYFVLIFLPLLGAFALAIRQGSFTIASHAHVKTAAYYFLFGGDVFVLALLILNVYAVLRILLWGADALLQKNTVHRKALRQRARHFVFSYLLLLVVLLSISLFMGGVASVLSATDAGSVAEASDTLNRWDKNVFGAFPFLWLASTRGAAWNIFADVSLFSYRALGAVVGFIFLVFLAADARVFMKYLIFFSLASLLAAPLWFLYPALSPFDRYVDNITPEPVPLPVAVELELYKPSPSLAFYHEKLRASRDSTGVFFALTTMPSMHAAWGIGSAYYLTALFPPLGFLIIPWALLEMVGAVYTAQHYGIDIPAGALVALVAIALSGFISRASSREEKETETRLSIAFLTDVVQEDIRSVAFSFGSFYRSARNYFRRRP